VETVYGTYLGSTEAGGSSKLGTLFEITGAGTLTTIHTFQGTEGEFPVAPLVPGPSGRFYGVNEYGTNNINGDILSITANGSNFKLVHRFPIGKTAAAKPVQLLVVVGGNFYGIMARGGANNAGTIFQMTPTGTVTILHDFSGYPTGGAQPLSLLQATDGNFYRGTWTGGTLGAGVAFKLSTGLPPFVETVPTSGCVGNVVVLEPT